jgi:Asp-tRNA(Asn)/Glu-tRNA(Gln) amidotransferase B subunit
MPISFNFEFENGNYNVVDCSVDINGEERADVFTICTKQAKRLFGATESSPKRKVYKKDVSKKPIQGFRKVFARRDDRGVVEVALRKQDLEDYCYFGPPEETPISLSEETLIAMDIELPQEEIQPFYVNFQAIRERK